MSIKYRPDIDGLRAIAVSLVVIFHAIPSAIPGGFIGVDIFFVISGFLITSLLIKRHDADRISILDFYKARLTRIVPALVLVLLSCLVFGWLALLSDEYRNLATHTWAGSIFVSNFLSLSEVGYFDGAVYTKPLVHLWSLGVEEQFYIVWPILMILVLRWRVLFWLTLAVGICLSLYFNVTTVTADQDAAYYLPQSRFWQLMVGALLAAVAAHGKLKIHGAASHAAGVVGIVMIAIGAALITRESAFPGWWAILPTVGAFLFILAGPQSAVNRLFSLKAIVWVGLISYPLYLWHWPILSFAYIIQGEAAAWRSALVLVGLAVILAAATYYLIERPLRFGRFRGRAVVPAASAAFLAAVGVAGLAVDRSDGVPTRSANLLSQDFLDQIVPWQYATNDTCLKRYPFEEVSDFRWWFCAMNRDLSPDVLIIGNSFANQIYPGLEQTEPFSDKTVLSIGTCAPIEVRETDPVGELTRNACTGHRIMWQQRLINLIIEREQPEMVIFAGLSVKPTDDYIERLSARVSLAESAGARAVLFYPTVRMDGDIRKCLPRRFKVAENDCIIPASAAADIRDGMAGLVSHIMERHPGAMFFDPNEVFCTGTECQMVQNGIPMLRDEWEHWSVHASNLVAERLAEELTREGIADDVADVDVH